MNMKDVKQIGARLAQGPKAKAAGIDAGAIRELAELLSETGLTELEVEQAGVRIRVARHASHVVSAPAYTSAPAHTAAAMPAAEPSAKPAGPAAGAVPSPMVGTVFVAPEPGKPPFVKVGDRVAEGDTLLIVEAMKTMNPILSPRSGTVSEICIRDAEPVEFGQTLLIIS